MFCTECGTKNTDTSKFCVACGKVIRLQPVPDQPPPVFQQQQYPPPMPPLSPQNSNIPVSGRTRMNKGIYMTLAAGGILVATLLTVWGATDSKVEELLYFSWLPLVLALIVLYTMIYKMWAAIQDGHARTTPGKAVGFMFIPLFNLYWFFQVFYGWAKDYNSYVARHQMNAPKVSETTFLVYVISSYVCFPVSIVMLFIVISRVCNAVNALRA
jgi:hypothetical protein